MSDTFVNVLGKGSMPAAVFLGPDGDYIHIYMHTEPRTDTTAQPALITNCISMDHQVLDRYLRCFFGMTTAQPS
jgi:hypothetical protein